MMKVIEGYEIILAIPDGARRGSQYPERGFLSGKKWEKTVSQPL
jgi:hypothetical protein